jgi:hypothetical protein
MGLGFDVTRVTAGDEHFECVQRGCLRYLVRCGQSGGRWQQ